jgi:hypothetical protein
MVVSNEPQNRKGLHTLWGIVSFALGEWEKPQNISRCVGGGKSNTVYHHIRKKFKSKLVTTFGVRNDAGRFLIRAHRNCPQMADAYVYWATSELRQVTDGRWINVLSKEWRASVNNRVHCTFGTVHIAYTVVNKCQPRAWKSLSKAAQTRVGRQL